MVAKLFTWVTIQETSVRNCFRGLLTANSTKVRTVAFHLLGCCETLVIKSSYFVSSGGWLNYERARKYKRLRIQVTWRDIDVTAKFGLGRGKLKNCITWEGEKLSRCLEPIKVAIQVLRREIGETDPPISNGFFIWLCCFFTDQSIFLEENRVTLRDAARNTKPTLATVQTAVEQYNEFQQFETSLRKLSSGWEEDEDQKSEYSKITR